MTNFLEHDIFGFDAPADPARWVFHYTSLKSALAIASSKELWLGSMAAMNDPREYKVAEPVTMQIVGPGGAVVPVDERLAIDTLVARRLDMRVASFTADAASGAPKTAMRAAGRGYARPSLWAHYGDRHQGVCIVFDRAALVSQLNATLGTNALHDLVTYVDGIDPNDWSGILLLDDVPRLGVDAAVDRHIRQHADRLVFTKNEDWRAEREWRCCALGQSVGTTTAIPLPGGVVSGLVLGLDFDESNLAQAQHFSATFRVDQAVARTYVHQLNMIDVLPIDSTSATWRYYTNSELKSLGYL
jgi:hypothetical protein